MRLGGQDVLIKEGTLAHFLYAKRTSVRERFRHRYEVDPAYIAQLEAGGMVFSGRHPAVPIMQVLELPASAHPYFIGGQFHPELTSRPLRPQPFFVGLIASAIVRRYGVDDAARQGLYADPTLSRWLRRTPAAGSGSAVKA